MKLRKPKPDPKPGPLDLPYYLLIDPSNGCPDRQFGPSHNPYFVTFFNPANRAYFNIVMCGKKKIYYYSSLSKRRMAEEDAVEEMRQNAPEHEVQEAMRYLLRMSPIPRRGLKDIQRAATDDSPLMRQFKNI